jgi:hypothetical protein
MQNAQEFLPPETYTSKDQKILTTEYTEITEEKQRKPKHKDFDLLCALCVLCGENLLIF